MTVFKLQLIFSVMHDEYCFKQIPFCPLHRTVNISTCRDGCRYWLTDTAGVLEGLQTTRISLFIQQAISCLVIVTILQ